jgi:hypothetical protein
VALKVAPSDDPAAYKLWHSKYYSAAFISSQTFFTRIMWNLTQPSITLLATWDEKEQQLETSLPR